MGRTLPTSTQLIQEFEESWRPYARALRKEDRFLLAELFAMVRLQSAAIAYASPPDPFPAFCLAMFGGMLKRIVQLEQALGQSESADAPQTDSVKAAAVRDAEPTYEPIPFPRASNDV